MELIDAVTLSLKYCSKPIQAQLNYAGNDNLTARPLVGYTLGVAQVAILAKEPAIQLCKVQNHLLEHFACGLRVYDAYRPKRAVLDLLQWSKRPPVGDAALAMQKKYHPSMAREL